MTRSDLRDDRCVEELGEGRGAALGDGKEPLGTRSGERRGDALGGFLWLGSAGEADEIGLAGLQLLTDLTGEVSGVVLVEPSQPEPCSEEEQGEDG
jgi:hypothetical protein